MTKAFWVKANPIDPATGLPVEVLFTSANSTNATLIENGKVYLPFLESFPVVTHSIFDGDLNGESEISGDDIEISANAQTIPLMLGYVWDSALVTIYKTDTLEKVKEKDGVASLTLKFTGVAKGNPEASGDVFKLSTTDMSYKLDVNLLTQEYAGSGSFEGADTMKGSLKPIALGSCTGVPLTLVEAGFLIYQYNAYGKSQGVVNLSENGILFGNPKSIVAWAGNLQDTYAALKAVTGLGLGQWVDCPSIGMIRLGGEPAQGGVLVADVVGMIPEGTGDGPTTLPFILGYLANLCKVSLNTGNITTFAGAVGNQSFGFFSDSQTKVDEVIKAMALGAGGYRSFDVTGRLCMGLIRFQTYYDLTVTSGGTTYPLVEDINVLATSTPFKRVRLGTKKVYRVHAVNEISDALKVAVGDIRTNLEKVTSDGWLSPSEKSDAIIEYNQNNQAYNAMMAKFVDMGSPTQYATQRDELTAARNLLDQYLGTLSPAWNDVSTNTQVVGATYRDRWSNYLQKIENFGSALLGRASQLADWKGVVGAGRPEDYADVTGTHTSLDTSNVAGRPSTTVNANADKAIVDINKLQKDYGLTGSAADAADRAIAANNAAQAAKTAAETARTDSQAARDAASGSASLSGSAKTAAESARDAASSSAASAATKASDANGYASTASGQATIATQKATDAGQSASNASASAATASTKAGEASTSASQALTSKNDAAGSASTAGTASTNAALARDSVIKGAAGDMPDDFTAGNTFWRSTLPGLPTRAVDFGSQYNFADPNFVRLQNMTKGMGYNVASLGSMPLVAGRRRRITMKWKVTDAGGAGNTTGYMYFVGLKPDWTSPSNLMQPVTIVSNGAGWGATNGYATHTFEANDNDLIATGCTSVRAAAAYVAVGTTDSVDFASILIEDITGAYAATTAASQASASNTAAGQSASAAAGSASTAQTKAGEASTSAGSAATSASDALGSKNSAATSSSLSATARDAANSTAYALMPSTFDQDGAMWAQSWDGPPTRPGFDGHFVFNAYQTRTLTVNADAALTQYDVAHRGLTKLIPNTTLRMTATWRIRGAAGTTRAYGVLYFIGTNSVGTSIYTPGVEMFINGSGGGWGPDTWAISSFDINANDLLAYANITHVRGLFRFMKEANGQVWELLSLKLSDVTSEKASAASASAANTSASSASASKDAAGSSASAANQSKLDAQTAKGGAEAARDTAVTSASNAQGSSNTAATQAKLAASAGATRGLTRNGNFNSSDTDWTYSALSYGNWYQGVGFRSSPGARGNLAYADLIAIDITRTYRLTTGYVIHGVDQVTYAGLSCFDKDRNFLGNIYMPQIFPVIRPGGTVIPRVSNDYSGSYPEATPMFRHGNSFPAATKFVQPVAYLNYDNTANAISDINSLFLEDVTSEVASQAFASASNNSASSASASKDAAGVSASAANQSRIDAQAANGAAQGAASVAQGASAAADASRSQAQTYASLSSSFGSSSLNRNPYFADPAWNGSSFPPNWGGWITEGYIGRFPGATAALQYPNPYSGKDALQIDRVNDNAGVTVSLGKMPVGYYVIEVDVGGESGTWAGAGVHINFNNGSVYTLGFHVQMDVAQIVTATANGRRQWSFLIANNSPTDNAQLYLMAGWTGFTGSGGNGFLRTVWYKALIRPATQADVQGRDNSARITSLADVVSNADGAAARRLDAVEARAGGLEATTSSTSQAVADLKTGRAAARLEFSAVTAGGRAALTIRSDNVGGAGVDIVSDVNIIGSNGGATNTLSGKGMFVRAANGNPAFQSGLY